MPDTQINGCENHQYLSDSGHGYSRRVIRDEFVQRYREIYQRSLTNRETVNKDLTNDLKHYRVKRFVRKSKSIPATPYYFEHLRRKGYTHIANFPVSLQELIYYGSINSLVVLDSRIFKHIADMSADSLSTEDMSKISQVEDSQDSEQTSLETCPKTSQTEEVVVKKASNKKTEKVPQCKQLEK